MSYYTDELNRLLKSKESNELIKEGFKYSIVVTAPCGTKTKNLSLDEVQLNDLFLSYDRREEREKNSN